MKTNKSHLKDMDLYARLQKKERLYISAKARGVKSIKGLTSFEKKKMAELHAKILLFTMNKHPRK